MRHLPVLASLLLLLYPATAVGYCGLSQSEYDELNDRNRQRLGAFEDRVGKLLKLKPEEEALDAIKTLVELSFNAYVCAELDEEFGLKQDERVDCIVTGPSVVSDRLEEERRKELLKILASSTESVQREYRESGWEDAVAAVWDLRREGFERALPTKP
ncbi:MAG TPA: hypothetical protein VF121_16910 [Thermoanaerobaculia bacterium]|nr:hypothetical protein [Thermoanaerobaculia bacterium]